MLKNNFLSFISLGILLNCFIAPFAHARYYDEVIESGFISVGVYRDFPPYSYIKDGKAVGIDIEIAKVIAKALNVKLTIFWVTPDENLEDDLRNTIWKGHYLGGGVADVMLRVPYDRDYSFKRDDQGLLINEQVVMLAPYQRERWQIVYNQKKIESINTLAIFQYHPIGVEIDSLPSFYLTSAFRGRFREKTQHYPTLVLAFKAMENNEVDAIMGMRTQAGWLQAFSEHKQFKLATNNYPMMGKQQWDIGIAVKHTFRQLGYAISDIIDTMVTSGELAKYFKQNKMIYELPGLYQDVNQ